MDNLSIGFPNIYVNFSKANGYCYVYAYTPQYDKETKRTKKTNVKSVSSPSPRWELFQNPA